MISKETKKLLETMASVNEDDYIYTPRGVKFFFENSLNCNWCQVIKYHDNYLVEFRKKTDNLIEGKKDILVSEDVVTPERFQEHFENKTSIYLNYMGI